MTSTDTASGLTRRELVAVAVLGVFIVVFISAIEIAPDYSRRAADVATRELAEQVLAARQCGVSERDLGRLVLDRIKEIGDAHPDVPRSEIVAQLASLTSKAASTSSSAPPRCADTPLSSTSSSAF